VRSLGVLRALAFCAATAAFTAGSAVGQQTGVSGRVTDASTGRPISGAQVSISNTTLTAVTSADGVYTLRNAAPGAVVVRALNIGFADQAQQVTLMAGQMATLNFELRPAPFALPQVVVTATGEQRRVEIANAIAHVDAAQLTKTSSVSNMADLLTARAAGVMVVPGTQTGAGVRVRIRGNSSISLSNNPIYVIDGVRVEGTTGSSSLSVGGTTVARINDINPDEIESIEIVRGPSASTLYGTDAANGVIVIKTKRGRAGRPQWTYFTEQTAIQDRNAYPDAYRAWRTGTTGTTNSTAANAVQCLLTQVASGACAQDSVTVYNLHRDKESTPYGTGYRQQHGLSVGGGNEIVRFFVQGNWEDEAGVMKVPEFDRRWLAARGMSLLPEQERPNHLGKVSGRVNLNVTLPQNVDLAISTGYINSALRLPRSDDSGTPGIAANTYGGYGYKYNVNAAGDTLHGWREYTPRQIYQAVTSQNVDRLISSLGANWTPQSWLAVRSTFGFDFISRNETQLCRFDECTSVTDRQGFKTDNRTRFGTYTADVGATAGRTLRVGLESQTAVGVQFTRSTFSRNGASATELTPGAVTVTAGANRSGNESNSETRTLGAYVEQRLGYQDKLFLAGAVRSDRNSAFGADFKTVFYPKLSASYVISEESFFPRTDAVNQLRLRAAYGASGVQPGTTDATAFYSPTNTVGESGMQQGGLVFSTLGNANLKPERSTELELGVDGTFLDNRLNVELTRYNKVSTDALISRVLPPSLGTGATSRFENLGEVRNWGWEALLSAQLLRGPRLGWDVSVNMSTNENELVSLGGVPPIITATIQRREGYPINGWWSRPLISYNDANGNNIIEPTEIEVGADPVYHGRAMPKYEAAISNGFDLFNRALRVSGMVDYKGGFLIYNNSERIRCASRNNCSGLLNPDASHSEQARAVAARQGGVLGTVAGYFEEGDFLRFREAAMTYRAPASLASRFLGSREVTATLAARNLGMLWSKYTGVDPEAYGTTGDQPSSFQAFGPQTFYSFRLSFGF
jgi:TonB-linked SusC/RagA family outer membrane protein